MVLNKNILKILKVGLGLLLFIWLSYSLYHQINGQKDLQTAFFEFISDWDISKVVFVIIVFLLMLANWSVESIKWQLLLKETEELSFVQSFQSVLTGLAVSIITPNRVGEYLGRILYLKNTNKLKGISINIVGSFAQILVTGFFGVLGLIFYLQHIEGSNFLYILLFSSIVISALMFYLLFNLGILIRVCDFLPFLKKIKIYINVVQRFEKGVLWRLIGYATCRYLIYSLQFYLLLRITHNYFLPIEVFSGIWLNFWVIAVVPSFVIADIGVRGKTAVEFLGFCSSNVFGLLSASILLWLVNLIMPALIGCFFVYRIKMLDEE